MTRFPKDNGVTIRALLDPHGELMRTYDLSEATEQAAPYPIHVVVDADGIVRMPSVKSGLSEILTTIEELLAEGDG